jgi:hypothetical protein
VQLHATVGLIHTEWQVMHVRAGARAHHPPPPTNRAMQVDEVDSPFSELFDGVAKATEEATGSPDWCVRLSYEARIKA